MVSYCHCSDVPFSNRGGNGFILSLFRFSLLKSRMKWFHIVIVQMCPSQIEDEIVSYFMSSSSLFPWAPLKSSMKWCAFHVLYCHCSHVAFSYLSWNGFILSLFPCALLKSRMKWCAFHVRYCHCSIWHSQVEHEIVSYCPCPYVPFWNRGWNGVHFMHAIVTVHLWHSQFEREMVSCSRYILLPRSLIPYVRRTCCFGTCCLLCTWYSRYMYIICTYKLYI